LPQRQLEIPAHIDAACFRLLCLIFQYDQQQGWAAGGFRSCAHWLSFRTGVDLGAAREKVRVARALSSLPRVSAAFEQARLSYSKVRAVTRIADEDNEQDWLAVALEATAAQLERLVRACRRPGSGGEVLRGWALGYGYWSGWSDIRTINGSARFSTS